MVAVTIQNEQKRLSLKSRQILQLTRHILRYVRLTQGSLAIVFVTQQKMQSLNRQYRHRHYATDVLAFDLREQKSANEITADIIISTDAVIKNAKIYKNFLSQELALYIIHGILHLCGYDDHRFLKKQQMRGQEKKVLNQCRSLIPNLAYPKKLL